MVLRRPIECTQVFGKFGDRYRYWAKDYFRVADQQFGTMIPLLKFAALRMLVLNP
jgi:hypothetical protein